MSEKEMATLNGEPQHLKRDLGLMAATAIGVSQMIGCGIYMAPQGLAEMSNPTAAIIACLITGIGTLLMALSFGRLGEKLPVSGSAVVYTRVAFGETASFIVGWSIWWSNMIGIPAIAISALAYASYFIPALATNPIVAFICAAAIMWIYTIINIYGIKGAGGLNLILTLIKLIPLVVFFIIAIIHFDSSNMHTVAAPENEGMGALPIAVAYLVWSFMGFEGSSINAGGFIALGVFISGVACVGAWVISCARISYSVGRLNIFPEALAKIHPKYKTPVNALLVNAIVFTLILFMNCTKGLVEAYNFLILMSSLAALIFYAFGVASELMLLTRKDEHFNVLIFIKNGFFSLIAFAYAIYAIYACGAELVMWGFIFIMIGIPFHVYNKYRKNEERRIDESVNVEDFE